MRITLGRRAALTTAATAALAAAGLTAGLSSAGAQTSGGCPGGPGIQFRSSLARIASTGCDNNNHPPSCSSVRPNVALLWPPNHKLRTITLSGATDPDGDAVTLTVATVTQDEPVNKGGYDAARSLAPGAVQLRSERLGTGDGRVYRIGFTGSDGHGGMCTGGVTVGVPHDMGQGRTPVDSGSVFNSFGA
jgi:hypothetical protein